MPISTKLLLCDALAVRGLGVLVRGLGMLLGFRGVLIALHVIVPAVLFGGGAMGLRGTLMAFCCQGMRHLHFDSFCWPARTDQRISGADRVANKCKSCSHQVKRAGQDRLTAASPGRRLMSRFITAVWRCANDTQPLTEGA